MLVNLLVNIYEKFVIINPGASGREFGELIDENDFLDLDDEFGYSAVSEEDKDNDEYFAEYNKISSSETGGADDTGYSSG